MPTYFANVLQPLIDACEAVLRFWHDLIGDFDGSWGVSIILLTFTVRLFILPLTFKGVKSMQRLQISPSWRRSMPWWPVPPSISAHPSPCW